MGRRRLSSADIGDEDRLLNTIRVIGALDTLDSMDRRDQQDAFQQEALNRQMEMRQKDFQLERERLDLGLATAQKQQDQDRLKIWNETRAEAAASHAALGVPKIDLDSPDGETQLGNWMSYAKAHGVQESSIQAIFEPRVRELAVKKEYSARAQAEALGADGLRLYNALRTSPGSDGNPMSPVEASDLAIKSKGAQKALADAQVYAQEKGMPFTLSSEDWKKIRKKIGTNTSVSAPTGVIPSGPNSVNSADEPEYTKFDPRPIYYDMDGVNEVLNTKLSGKYDQLAKDQAAAQQIWQQGQQANTAQSQASAEKTATETAILKGNAAYIFQTPQAVQAGKATDSQKGSPQQPDLGKFGFGRRPVTTK